MDDVMFDLPNKGVAAQRIHGQPHHIVDPFLLGEAIVTGVVHNIKRYTDQCQSEEYRCENTPQPAIMTQ